MELKICHQCKRPFLAKYEACPKCPDIDKIANSGVSLGCFLAMVLPLFLMLLFWFLFFLGVFIR